MTDRVTPEQRSKMMAAVRGKNTAAELSVRRRLHKDGFRFRVHAKYLPGSPDIVLPRFHMAVYVHGCFWHGHACKRGKRPATNTQFWNEKIDSNVQRDRRNQKELKAAGWTFAVVWECRLQSDANKLIRRLAAMRD